MDDVTVSNQKTDRFTFKAFNRFKVKPLAIFALGSSLLLLMLVGGVYQYSSEKRLALAHKQLKAVSNYKQQTISTWLFERRTDIKLLIQNKDFIERLKKSESDSGIRSKLLKRLDQIQSFYHYGKITALSSEGKILVETSKDVPLSMHGFDIDAIKNNEESINLSKMFFDKGNFHMDFIAPLFETEGQTTSFSGVVVFHTDPAHFIQPFVKRWPTPSETSESILILPTNQGIYYLNKRRFDDSDVGLMVNEKLHDVGKDILLLLKNNQKKGFIESTDYRDKNVFAYFEQVPGTEWFLVSKIDQSEIYNQLYILLLMLLGVGILIISVLLKVVATVLKQDQLENETRILKESHKALRKSEERFQTLFEKAPLAYQSLDKGGLILAINEAWLNLFGYEQLDKDHLIGLSFSTLLTVESKKSFSLALSELLENGKSQHHHIAIITKQGKERLISITGRIIKAEDGKLKAHCALEDVTEAIEANKSLKLAAKVFENTGEGVMVTDKNCRIISVNQAFTDILGYSETEIRGHKPKILRSGKHDEAFYDEMWRDIRQSGGWKGEIWNRHKSGALIPEWLTITKLLNESNEVEKYIGVFADISKLKSSEAELTYISNHDALTDLPNRRSLMTSVNYAVMQSNMAQTCFAVMVLDLDRFKEVNDSFGHAIGDEVLLHVSHVLKNNLRDIDVVSRFGGDEFAILVSHVEHDDDPGVLAKQLIEKVSEAFKISSGAQMSMGCSIGISLFPEHSKSADELVQQADTALYLSKKNGRGSFEYFTSEMTVKAQNRIQTEIELKKAIEDEQLEVYFQPQVDLRTETITGAEALVRWNHPTRGLVGPADFIPIAEDSILIADIGDWVLNETCYQAKKWVEKLDQNLTFAVNVSAKQIVYRDLLKSVMSALEKSQLPAEMLELELTESSLMNLGTEMQHTLEQLRGLGVRIAIDDFGTGYSSLAYLRSLPLDLLKIDKQFVDDIPNNTQGMQIVNTIIAMAHNLRLDVLAEGVETEEQRAFLAVKGCDYYQGYLKSTPLPAKEFEVLLFQKQA